MGVLGGRAEVKAKVVRRMISVEMNILMSN